MSAQSSANIHQSIHHDQLENENLHRSSAHTSDGKNSDELTPVSISAKTSTNTRFSVKIQEEIERLQAVKQRELEQAGMSSDLVLMPSYGILKSFASFE